jgi:hypothetical protein
MDVQYEEVKGEIRRRAGASHCRESAFTDGQFDSRSYSRSPTSVRQLRHIALLVISEFMS